MGVKEMATNAMGVKPLVIDTETRGLDTFNDKMLGMSTYQDGVSYYGLYLLTQEQLDTSYTILHNGKFDAKVLKNNCGLDLRIDFDTILAYGLLYPNRSRKLETIVKDLFDIDKEDLVSLFSRSLRKERLFRKMSYQLMHRKMWNIVIKFMSIV